MRLEVVTNWDISTGIRMESLRRMATYKYNSKWVAATIDYPRIVRKLLIQNTYKHIVLENNIRLQEMLETQVSVSDLNNQDSSPAFTFQEFLQLTAKVPDYYRLLYHGNQQYHIYVTKDWFIFGGATTMAQTSIPVPN